MHNWTVRFLFLSFVFAFSLSTQAAEIVVRDQDGRPVAGATVTSGTGFPLLTNGEGRVSVDGTAARVRVEKGGFEPVVRDVGGSALVEIVLRPALAESIVVSGIRAEEVTPVTKSNMDRAEIDQRYHQQDIPLLLRELPGVTAYTESGVGGSGYSYIAMRGIGSSRINFTLDGVPLADAEDMATYFADFPDLARSLQSVQVQRGVGTSTVGSASFGGSVNLESIALAPQREIDVRLSAGSFGARYGSVGVQSGDLGGLLLYGRLSLQQSDGFRRNSGISQHNLFVSAVRQGDRSQLRLTGFTAHERQQMAFYASDALVLESDPRDNPLHPEERDSFGYDLAQLQYVRTLSPAWNTTSSAYYQRGYGWYRLFDDNPAREGLAQYGLDGLLLGTMTTVSWSGGAWSVNGGLHVNRFVREHTRDVVGGRRDYANEGTKREANAFAKVQVDAARWHFYADGQVRTADFRYRGDVAIRPIRWTFFNPRVGARRQLTSRDSLYASLGFSTREPARTDLFFGEDNASVAYDLRAVRPEKVRDLEAGWSGRRGGLAVDANVYLMDFRDEIAATGELSEIGLPLRRNVDRSSRRGVELDARWQPSSRLRFRTVASVSRNRIARWTQSYDVYDEAGSYVESRLVEHRDVDPLLTPRVVVNQSVDGVLTRSLAGSLTVRYAGASYLDNTSNDELRTPPFTTLDATLAWTAGRGTKLTLQVNNLTDVRRVYASGYSYPTMTPAGVRSGYAYYYPQATRNFVLTVEFVP